MPITQSFFSSIFFASLWIGSAISLNGQPLGEDSLLQIVQANKNDNATFRAFKKLGELNEKTIAPKAVSYYLKALAFPFHMEYSREFVQTYTSLGELYHILGKYDSSLLMHRQALGIAQKFNYENEIAETYQGIAMNFIRQSQPDSAWAYLQQGLTIWVRLRNLLKQA